MNYFDDFLDFVIENRPTSQCHVVTFGHLITYDQWKYQMPKSMQKDWVLLHLSKDFQASIKFEPCQILPHRQCVCGVKIIHGHQEEFKMDFCVTSKNKTSRISETSSILTGRNKTMAYVSDFFHT